MVEDEPLAFEARDGFVELRDGDEQRDRFSGCFGHEKPCGLCP